MKIDAGILDSCKKGFRVIGDTTQLNHRALIIQRVCELESDLCGVIADFFVLRNGEVNKQKIIDDLYTGNGMLSSLNKITKIAFYLGFVTQEQNDDLLKLTKLRNRYGHDKHRGQLDDEPEMVKLITDTNLYNQNKNELSELRPQAIFLAIHQQLTKQIAVININV